MMKGTEKLRRTNEAPTEEQIDKINALPLDWLKRELAEPCFLAMERERKRGPFADPADFSRRISRMVWRELRKAMTPETAPEQP